MVDEKNKKENDALREEHILMMEELKRLRAQTDAAEEYARREKLRREEDFRNEAMDLLKDLTSAIDGNPERTIRKIEALAECIGDYPSATKERLASIESQLQEVLKIKEEQSPRWVKIFGAYAIVTVSVITAALLKVWWELSGLGKHLPDLLQYLALHEDIKKVVDMVQHLLQTLPNK